MTTLTLERFAYTPTETQGILTAGRRRYYTIERPWMVGPHPGGLGFSSAIPDGRYSLVKHTRPDGTKTVALVNKRLGVWHKKEHRPNNWGRYLILIHSGNYVNDVVGCIAPGLFRTIYNNRIMVTNSRAAMNRLNVQRYKTLVIKSTPGAIDKGVTV